jgi:hypothetical protein
MLFLDHLLGATAYSAKLTQLDVIDYGTEISTALV